jgi:SpoVK/Ycf46/Vps4 family AAA+-type ATPase
MNHKLIVQSLVAAHFEKQKVQRNRPVLGPVDQDLVRGKGSGLFILLHGVPGVGKTATAEAVAQANKKPLFTITCGDLGLTPEAVDSKLNEVFRLAHLWDCVLLLDEADVFLARRDTYNLQRNALVSGK